MEYWYHQPVALSDIRRTTLRQSLRAGSLEQLYPAVAVAGHFSKSVRSGAPGPWLFGFNVWNSSVIVAALKWPTRQSK